MLKWALPLLIMLAPAQIAMACSSPPGWRTEATYQGDDAIVVAELGPFVESPGEDGALLIESSFRVIETVRGDVPALGTAVEIGMPIEPAVPNADGVVFEIACSNRILYQSFAGRPHLLFLARMNDGRWQVRWGSTPMPEASTPASESMLSEVRRLASLQRPQ
ncbi:hypothetical protein [Luteimonas kalidii]|uniref:DUF4136 domain-containing protein n=1 Tax=Luteimonas kalidii TaxID=3042025 RepID=A0ABT6JPT2_9GAMM|nr:hypothetical protein [Luteimonas kalidii]MDH5832515.1 hypothetical protein [Luteimonas kalidii]